MNEEVKQKQIKRLIKNVLNFKGSKMSLLAETPEAVSVLCLSEINDVFSEERSMSIFDEGRSLLSIFRYDDEAIKIPLVNIDNF